MLFVEQLQHSLRLWCLTPLSTIFQSLSVALVEKTGTLDENQRPAQVTDKLYHILLYQVHLA